MESLIRTYIEKRRDEKLEAFDKQSAKLIREAQPEVQVETEQQRKLERASLEEKFIPANWLSDAARRAGQISIVTHAAKFTHGDSKSISILLGCVAEKPEGFLATCDLETPTTDVVGNAAALDVANLLLLNKDGFALSDLVATGDLSPFQSFTDDPEQITEWLLGLSKALKNDQLSSHTLAKQIYFPVDTEKQQYHLLSPLASSSLIDELNSRIENARFSDSAKAAREARKKQQYSDTRVQEFPGVAVQGFGGTKPQNISLRNSQRRGVAYLLNSQPPVWQPKTFVAPLNDAQFWREIDRVTHYPVKALQVYLTSIRHIDSNRYLRHKRARLVAEVTDCVLHYLLRLRQQPVGWSLDGQLSAGLWLYADPGRNDGVAERPTEKFADNLVARLGEKLNSKAIQISDAEHTYWKALVEKELEQLREVLL